MDTATIKDYEIFLGYNLNKYKINNKIQKLINCVIPLTGKHILECALMKHDDSKIYQGTLFEK